MASEQGKIRVLLVDDHPLTVEGARGCLERTGGIQVVAATGSGGAALLLLERHRPDVLILEVKLPDLSGIEVARRVRAGFPRVRILVLTAYDEAVYFEVTRAIGVHGYLAKSVPCDVLATAVRRVAMGGTFLETMFGQEALPGGDRSISDRQRAILVALAQGKRNSEIAADLAVSTRTVEYHLTKILPRLHSRTKTEAALKAREIGFVPTDPAAMELMKDP